jgi:hypothetical protein
LLRSKLRPPPVRARLIPRARPDGLLEARANGRLCLIGAPAGSGKTTLLAQWWRANHGTRRVAWLSLDEGHQRPQQSGDALAARVPIPARQPRVAHASSEAPVGGGRMSREGLPNSAATVRTASALCAGIT